MALINNWVSYIDRSYEQIKTNVLTKFQSLVPDITDHSESNIWVKGISIWSGMTEMLGYYIDNRAREVFLPVLRRFSSAVRLARLVDYRVKGSAPATVDLLFTTNLPVNIPVSIPAGTICKTADNVQFVTTESAIIGVGQSSAQVKASQYTQVSGAILGTSNGTSDQVFESFSDVADSTMTISVNSVNWSPVDTLAYSIPTSQHFVCAMDENQVMSVVFGDGVNGAIPQAGQDIVASYQTTLGSAGNVAAQLINTIVSTLTVEPGITISVTNNQKATGGVDAETIQQLRKSIPYSVRTKYRSVTEQDFKDLAVLVNGVGKAGVMYECGTPVKVYIAPIGGGVASNTLINNTKAFYDERRIITVGVEVLACGEVSLDIFCNVKALPNISNTALKTTIENNLTSFLSVDNQDIFGKVYLSDLYEVIENTKGVENSDITNWYANPYATPKIGVTTALVWTRTVKMSDATNKWKIRFLSPTTFELTKDSLFIGNYSIGATIIQPEIEFVVNTAPYLTNYEYTFYTYPTNPRRIELQEPSIPVTSSLNLFINVTGGI